MRKSWILALGICAGIVCLASWRTVGVAATAVKTATPVAKTEAPAATAATPAAKSEALTVGEDDESTGAVTAVEGEPAAEAAPAPAAKPAPRAMTGSVKLTQVRVTRSAGLPQVHLATNGRVRSSLTYLTRPERVLIKLENTQLTWKPTTQTFAQPPLQRIRAAQHDRDAWVVLDLTAPTRWSRSAQADGVHLRPQGMVPKRAARAAVETAVAPETPADTSAVAGASYRVIDLAAEDLGEKTRVTVTTDGPPRYRIERARRGDDLTLVLYGSALAVHKNLGGPISSAVARVAARTDRLEGEPVVILDVHLVRATPYTVLKEQNQVVLELDNPAPVNEAAPNRGSLRARLSVDFQGADLLAVLRALAQDTGFDLVMTPGAQDLTGGQGQVTVTVNEQPLEQVLDLVLRPRRMAYEVTGNTLRVGMAAEFPTETRVFTLKNLDAKQGNLKESLEGAFTEGARSKVILDEYANRVIVTAIPSDLLKAEDILTHMDSQPRLATRTYALNYADAGKLAALLRPMLSSLGRLEVSERDNALVLTDIPGNAQHLAALIRSLDTKAKQVMIEAWIVEIGLSDEQSLGVSWSGASVNQNPSSSASQFAPNPFTAMGQLTVGTVQPNFNLNATLSALEAKGALNTLSNPRIATLDNQNATITASQNIPYQTSVVSNGVVRTVVEYLQLPITLTVTPHISQNNQVMFDPATLTVTTVVDKGTPPETATRSASTQMTVANGDTIAIGGLVRDVERSKDSRVPILGDIPLLGFLFRSTTVSKEKVELVVFLTPHVLD